jgi:UDP-N-acetyl-D-glucosamine dehydrogenase
MIPSMPQYVVERLAHELDQRMGCGLRGAKIFDRYDPCVTSIPSLREYPQFSGRQGLSELPPEKLKSFDAVLISTDQDKVDYATLCANSKLVVDTRNACAHAGITSNNIVKA